MRTERLLRRFTAFLLAAVMSACSGGNVDVSVGGPGGVVVPPLPPVQGSEPVVAHGEVTGFGGITINGVRYETVSTTVTVNGDAASMPDLRQGMVVTLSGRINDDGTTGRATTVRFDADVLGPVEGIDAPNGQLVVMGQTVATNADTNFGGGIDPTTYAGLDVGDVVQVSGHTDAAGAVHATRIEPAANQTRLQVIGTVADLDPANMLFRINRLTVDYSNALVIDLPGGAPANGMDVMVFGTKTAGFFAVERLVAAPSLEGPNGRRVQIAGIVTRFDSAADFDVDRLTVRADATTVYQNGTASDIALNAELTVDGDFTSNGRMSADRVTFGPVAADAARLTFDLRDFTEISVPTVFNVTLTRGSDYSIEVFVDRGHENRIDVTQVGSRLTIALQPGNGRIRTLEAVITMPTLDRIDLSGVVTARLFDFDQSQMTINVGGVSYLRGNGLRVANLTAAVSGVSRMDLVDVRPIGNANINVTGVSQATLNMDVGATMTGSVGTGQGTGVSTLFYYGTNVDVNVTTDFLSSVVWLGHTRP